MAFFSASRTVPAKRAGTGPEPFDRSAFVTLLIADSLHAAPLAGYWCRCFKPKMYVFILLIRIHQLVPRKA